MTIRGMLPSDIPRLEQLHKEAGFDYPFPKLDKDFLPVPVIVDENNQVVMAIASMPCVEVFFFMDKNWETPGMKMEAFRLIHEFARRELSRKGFVEVNAFLPPEIEKSFGRKLIKKFKWRKGLGWPCFSRRLDNV